MMQWVAPASFSIRVETSPVNAPSSAKWTFWDDTPIPLPWTSCATAPIDGYGGARTISIPRTPATSGRKARTKAAASPAVLYIFQFPAMTGTRIQFALDTYFARSTRRQEYPHSLSYQASTFAIFPPITLVDRASKEADTGSWLKSTETSGSSTYWRIPFIGPSEAFRIAALISSAEAFFDSSAVRSTRETFGVGTRIAIPSSFPFSSGMTSETALAAPVVVGIIETPAARARRRSLCGRSRIFWSFV